MTISSEPVKFRGDKALKFRLVKSGTLKLKSIGVAKCAKV